MIWTTHTLLKPNVNILKAAYSSRNIVFSLSGNYMISRQPHYLGWFKLLFLLGRTRFTPKACQPLGLICTLMHSCLDSNPFICAFHHHKNSTYNIHIIPLFAVLSKAQLVPVMFKSIKFKDNWDVSLPASQRDNTWLLLCRFQLHLSASRVAHGLWSGFYYVNYNFIVSAWLTPFQ